MAGNDQYYQGAQDQSTTAADYNSRDFHIRQRIADIRTGIPVKIIRAPYDKNGNAIPPGTVGPIGFVDVQPMVNQIDGLGNATQHGVVYRLKYYRYQGANGSIISDPVIGDIGHMAVADRDTTSVRATDAIANPGSRRTHDLADGTYFGCSQAPGNPTQYIVFGPNGLTIHDNNGNSVVMSPSGIVMTDKTGNTITMVSGGITIHGIHAIALTAPPNTITANGNVLG